MQTYTIKQISELFHIPSSTLRYYEDMGLLVDVQRTPNGQRCYTEEHIQRLYAIGCFKNTGLSIAKMQDFFQYENNIESHIDDIIQLVTEHESSVKEQIARLKNELDHIEHKVRYYNGIKKAMDTNAPWPCWEDC